MKVRVKEEMSGFIYGELKTSGQEFTLKPVEHSTKKDENGDPAIISVKTQFSKKWMESLEKKVEKKTENKEPEKKVKKKTKKE